MAEPYEIRDEDSGKISKERGEDSKKALATWLPKIENSGYYNVYVQHPEGNGDSTISDNALYTITHASRETVVRLNQREKVM